MPILKACYPWLAQWPRPFRPLQDLPTLSASNAPAWWDFLGNSTAEVSQFQPNINLMALGHKIEQHTQLSFVRFAPTPFYMATISGTSYCSSSGECLYQFFACVC